MRILLNGSRYYNYLHEKDFVPGGIEMILLTAIKLLSEKGHEVHLTYVGDDAHPSYSEYATLHKLADICANDFRENHTKQEYVNYNKKCRSKFVELAESMADGNTIVHNNDTNMSVIGDIAKLSEKIPVVYYFHSLPPIIHQYPTICKAAKTIQANGGIIYATQIMEHLTSQQMKKIIPSKSENDVMLMEEMMNQRLINYYAKCFIPFAKEFFDSDVVASSGNPMSIARYDPVKNLSKMATSGVNIDIWTAGATDTQIERLEKKGTAKVYHNKPRSEIIEALKKTPASISAYAKESGPIITKEGMMFGAMPIFFKNKFENDYHSDMFFSKDILGDLAPREICYEDENWKSELQSRVDDAKCMSLNERIKIAELTRDYFSEANYVKEFENVLETALNKFNATKK